MRPVPVAPLTIADRSAARRPQDPALRGPAARRRRRRGRRHRAQDQGAGAGAAAGDRRPAGRTSRTRSVAAPSRADFSSSPFVTGISLRAARGRFGVPGPGAIWYRVDRPLVEGVAGFAGDARRGRRGFLQRHLGGAGFPAMDLSSMPTSPSVLRASRSASGSCSMRNPGSVPMARASPWRGSPTAAAISAAPCRASSSRSASGAETRRRRATIFRLVSDRASIGVDHESEATRASADRRLLVRRDPLRDRVVSAAALHLQLHQLPDARPAARSRSTCRCVAKDFHILQGEPKGWRHISPTGVAVISWFCGDCGGRLYGERAGRAEIVNLRAGTLDDTSWLVPVAHMFMKSAQPWVLPAADAECHEIGPT